MKDLWVSVKDRLPEKSGEYFVYAPNRPTFFPYCCVEVVNYNHPDSYASFTDGWVYYGRQSNQINDAVTHWQYFLLEIRYVLDHPM